jgi:hypothetical protein
MNEQETELARYIARLSYDFNEDVALFHALRTYRHIDSVRKMYSVLRENTLGLNKIPQADLASHDADKLLRQDQFLPYCLINWKYKCKSLDIPWEIPAEFAGICHDATVRHVQLGEHHPEFWDPNQEDLISAADRDGVSRIIDGTKMPPERIEEMAADICAVAKERGTSPVDWVQKNLYTRWNLSPQGAYTLIHSVNKIVEFAGVDFVAAKA